MIQLLDNSRKDDAISFLEQHVSTSMFMLENITQIGLNPVDHDRGADYFIYLDDTQTIQGIMCLTNKGFLQSQMPGSSKEKIPEMLKTLLEYTQRGVHGIAMEDSQFRIVLDTLNIPENLFDLNETEKLFQVDLKTASLIAEKSDFTICGHHDIPLDLVTQWMVDYDVEALGTTPSKEHMQQTHEDMKNKPKDVLRWGLKSGNDFIAYGGFNSSYKEFLQVGPMWTPVKHRGKGYARYLLSRMLEWGLNNGYTKSLLFTNNLPAIKAYEALGYQEMGTFSLALLNQIFVPKG